MTSTQAHSLFVVPCSSSFSDLLFRRFRLGIDSDVDARLASSPLRNYMARSRPRPSGWLYHSDRLSAHGRFGLDLARSLDLAWLDPCGSGLGTCSRLLASIVWTDVERFRVRHSRFRSSAREGTTRNCTPTYEAQLGVTGKSPHPRYAVSIEAPFRSPIPLSLLSIHFSTSPNPLWRWCLLHARRVAATTCGRHQRLFPHVRAMLGLRLEICKRNL